MKAPEVLMPRWICQSYVHKALLYTQIIIYDEHFALANSRVGNDPP